MNFKKILTALVGTLIIAYLLTWYLSCKWLEDRIPKEEFTLNLGTGPNNALKGSLVFDNVHYSGLFSGRAAVSFNITSANYEFLSAKDATSRPLKSVVETNGSSLIYKVEAPLYGNTITWEIPNPGEMKNSLEIVPGSTINTYSKFSGGGLRVFLNESKFLALREPISIEQFSRPKEILSLTNGVELLPGESSFQLEGTPEPAFTAKIGPSKVNWDFKEPNVLHLNSSLDLEAEYGKNFFSQILKMGQDLPSAANKRLPIDNETFAVVQKVESVLLEGANKLLLKGELEFAVPYDVKSVEKLIKEQGTPPAFFVRFNNLSIQFPFLVTAKRVINGLIECLRGAGHPLSVNLHVYTDAFPIYLRSLAVLEQLSAFASDKFPELNLSKKEPRDLVNFEQINGPQGMYILAIASLKAYDEIISAPPLDFDFKLTTNTASGTINPIEFLGAKSNLSLEALLGEGVSVKANAKLSGITMWNANVAITNVRQLLEKLSTVQRIGLAHAFLYSGDKSKRPPEDTQKQVIQFLFSEEFGNQMIETSMTVLQKLDQTPETPGQIQISLDGRIRDIMINGQTIEQFRSTHEKFVEEEFRKLFLFVQSKIAKFDQEYAEKVM